MDHIALYDINPIDFTLEMDFSLLGTNPLLETLSSF